MTRINLTGFDVAPIVGSTKAESLQLGHDTETAADSCHGVEAAQGYRMAADHFDKANAGRFGGHYTDRSKSLREKADQLDPPIKTVDATPSFEGAVNMCLVVLENGTEEGKAIARDELRRYARELDRLAAQSGSAFDPTDTPMEGE
jgi:hypothetical protein